MPLDHDAADLPDAIRGLGRRYRMPLTRFLAGEDPDTIVRARPAPDSLVGARVRVPRARRARGLQRTGAPHGRRGPARRSAGGTTRPRPTTRPTTRRIRSRSPTRSTATPGPSPRPSRRSRPRGWSREGVRRSGELFTILGVGRFVLHEGHHHLLDVGRSLRAARGR